VPETERVCNDRTAKNEMKYRKKSDPTTELKRSLKKINWRLLAQLAVSLAVTLTLYEVFIYYKIPYIIHIYAAVLLALSVAYVILARGYSCRPFDESLLPDDWDAARRAKYLESDAKRKRIAKKLLLFIIPIMLTFMLDMLYINFLSDL
jgi:Ca2+/Na+ antiporter